MNPIVKNGNKFRWKFDNIQELADENIFSNTFTIDPVDWSIAIGTANSNKGLCLTLGICYESDNKKEKNWICEVDAKFRIFSPDGSGETIIEPLKTCLLEGQIFRACFIDWSEFIDGYLEDDSMNVEIEFNFRYYDFSKQIEHVTDIIVNVEDTDFHLNKWALGSRSKYFYDLILNTKPKDVESIKLDDVKAEHFCYMLASFYPFFDTILKRNCVDLMAFARKFGVPSIHHKCEQLLISKTGIAIIDKIKLADENDYEELMKSCIDSLKSGADVRKLQADLKFSQLKESTKSRIVYRCLDFC